MDKKKRIIEECTPQEKESILANFMPFLSKGKFVNIATCNLERMPSVAPKLIGKTEKNSIYLIDYVMGKTYSNIKQNPRVSLSFINDRTLTGYQFNGTAIIIEEGEEFDKLTDEFQRIKTNFTVERILLDVRKGKKTSPSVEFSLPKKFIILKVKVFEIVEISSSGGLKSKFTI